MSLARHPAPLAQRVALHTRRCHRAKNSTSAPRGRCSRTVAMAGFNRYGVKEVNPSDGTFMETYGLNLGGGNISRSTESKWIRVYAGRQAAVNVFQD